MYQEINFSQFPPEREQKLKEIYRFNMFKKFFYRSNLWMHTHRVLWLVEKVLPIAEKHFSLDGDKARILALVHDDTEMIIGDIPSAEKIKMKGDKLKEADMAEENAIKELVKKYPKTINSHSYEELLNNVFRKDCIEIQLVSFLDKLDAQCESVHEVFAGNLSLLHSVMYYSVTLSLFPKKFPRLISLFEDSKSPLTYLKNINFPHRTAEAKFFDFLNMPHTKESLERETLLPFYNEWKDIVMGKKEGLKWITEQIEF